MPSSEASEEPLWKKRNTVEFISTQQFFSTMYIGTNSLMLYFSKSYGQISGGKKERWSRRDKQIQ